MHSVSISWCILMHYPRERGNFTGLSRLSSQAFLCYLKNDDTDTNSLYIKKYSLLACFFRRLNKVHLLFLAIVLVTITEQCFHLVISEVCRGEDWFPPPQWRWYWWRDWLCSGAGGLGVVNLQLVFLWCVSESLMKWWVASVIPLPKAQPSLKLATLLCMMKIRYGVSFSPGSCHVTGIESMHFSTVTTRSGPVFLASVEVLSFALVGTGVGPFCICNLFFCCSGFKATLMVGLFPYSILTRGQIIFLVISE